jgi:CO/xanthine dehydrogenase Mo-binding subunit
LTAEGEGWKVQARFRRLFHRFRQRPGRPVQQGWKLEVPLERVDMLMGDTDLCPWDGGTGGSLSIWQFGPVLCGAAGGPGRALQLASEHLRVPLDRLEVRAGVVSVQGAPTQQVTYGQLVQGKRIERHLTEVKPKPVSAYTLVGTSAPRKDARKKVLGAARFTADQGLPGTLHACILRPPAHGCTLKSVDTSAAERMPGVRVLRDGDLVAVLHALPDQARKALGLVKATFTGMPAALDDVTIRQHLAARLASGKVSRQEGELKAAEARAAKPVEAESVNAYVAHAPLEPHSALAQWKDGRMTVWAGVQAPFRVKAEVAGALKLPAEQVRIITPPIGGAFGGKSAGPQAVEAAITMGIGYALSEGIRFKDGRILDENFDTYQLPRFSWLPAMDTVLVPNPGLQPQSGGEPPIVCMGAVLTNAIHDALGVRVFELPMTPARILEALKKG